MFDQPSHRRSVKLQNLDHLLLERQFVRPNHVLDLSDCPLHKHITLTVPGAPCSSTFGVSGLDVTSRPQCSSFRVIVSGLSLGDVVEVGIGKKEVEDKVEESGIARRSENSHQTWMSCARE